MRVELGGRRTIIPTASSDIRGIPGFGSTICAGVRGQMAERKTARCYPLRLEQEADGGYVVTIPDIGYGATQGDTLEKALHQAEDLLEEGPALTAAKLELYRAMRAAGFGKEEFAARLKWTPSQMTRLFDGRHAVRLDQVETALATLGRRLVVTSEAA